MSSRSSWSNNWGPCKLKLTININQVKWWSFKERGNRSTRRKPLGAENRTNKLNPHLTPDLGIKPGPRWWKASALTTAPSQHPQKMVKMGKIGGKDGKMGKDGGKDGKMGKIGGHFQCEGKKTTL